MSEADKLVDFSLTVSAGAKAGLRMTMTVIPIIGLVVALFWFKKRFLLSDQYMADVNRQLAEKNK